MKPIYEAKIIQIEITNACWKQCANCSRHVGHHKKTYFMSLAEVENAIDSLEGFPGTIGVVGGEPTLHPEFTEICKLLQSKLPRWRCALFTSGYKWEEYKPIAKQTFGYGIFYNDHADPDQCHQPALVAIDEVIEDKELMWRLIDKCWVQETWSASINPKGAFFCEFAASLDMVFGMEGGYPVEKGWWKRTPSEFQDQVRKYCVLCSGALPMERPPVNSIRDSVSIGNLERLRAAGSPKAARGLVQIVNRRMDEEVAVQKPHWKPGWYLGSELRRKKNLKWNELWLLRGGMGLRRRYIKLRAALGMER